MLNKKGTEVKGNMKRFTVLLASNNSSRRAALRAALKRTTDFLIVGEADNGQEALEMVRLRRPRLLIIDSALPGMDGVSVLRKIREEGIEKTLTIMVTQYAGSHYRQVAQELGVEVCLQHPIGEKPMIGHMRALLRAALTVPMSAKIETRIGGILSGIGIQPNAKGYQ